MTDPKPTIGRIVHYHTDALDREQKVFAAIICAIDETHLTLNAVHLTVFRPGTLPSNFVFVPHKDHAEDGGSYWDWPVRV